MAAGASDVGPRADTGRSDATPSTVGAFYRDFYARSGSLKLNPRMRRMLRLYAEHRKALGRPVSVLDVGSGPEVILSRYLLDGDSYTGCDIVPPVVPVNEFAQVDLNEDDLSCRFHGRAFDVIFCGEVIEHVFSPDALLESLKALLSADGVLLLSTPNLAYWANRLLLLAGISPLFLENSSRAKLGRRLKALGQGNTTEGHLRVFTHRAMLDLLSLQRLEVLAIHSYPPWRFPIDDLVCRFSHHLAPGNIYQVRLPASTSSGLASTGV